VVKRPRRATIGLTTALSLLLGGLAGCAPAPPVPPTSAVPPGTTSSTPRASSSPTAVGPYPTPLDGPQVDGLVFLDAALGIAAAGDRVWVTDDGGRTWTTVAQPETDPLTCALAAPSIEPGGTWFLAEQLAEARSAETRLVRSLDRGATWGSAQVLRVEPFPMPTD
jgi:hypothetical protein